MSGLKIRVSYIVCFFTLFMVLLAFPKDGTPSKTDSPSVLFLNSVPYISALELGKLFTIPVYFDDRNLSLTLNNGADSLTVAHLSRIAVINEKSVNMMLPAKLVRGAIYVPAKEFLPIFSKLTSGTIKWDEKNKKVISSGFSYTINKLSIENFSNGTMIKISCSKPLKPKVEIVDNNWLIITLPGGKFNQTSLATLSGPGLILDKKYMQNAGGAVFSFRLSMDYQEYQLSSDNPENEITISLFKKRNEVTIPKAAPQKEVVLPKETAADPLLWRIDTVVIDPGHGGEDSGARGPSGTNEKDVVLAVSKELARIIQERGEMEAVLTRDKDVFIPLHQRAKIAVSSGGKLFVSIHANASKAREAAGFEVFFLSDAKTDDAAMVAERENQSAKFEKNPSYYASLLHDSNLPKDVQDIQLDIASNVFLKESQDICSILADKVSTVMGQTNRGVKQAGFYVMLGTQATMPSILAEIGFISNPREEKLLNRVSYQKRLAETIYDAIITFKERHEHGMFSGSE